MSNPYPIGWVRNTSTSCSSGTRPIGCSTSILTPLLRKKYFFFGIFEKRTQNLTFTSLKLLAGIEWRMRWRSYRVRIKNWRKTVSAVIAVFAQSSKRWKSPSISWRRNRTIFARILFEPSVRYEFRNRPKVVESVFPYTKWHVEQQFNHHFCDRLWPSN